MTLAGTVHKIVHVDMDAFFASVEQRDRPDLRGKPVVVGGPPNSRSVVCAASYEARRFGVRSAMPCSRAARLCPTAIFVPPDFARYKEASQAIHRIFARWTELIEPLSLDEAYLDVTRNHADEASATRVATAIRAAIRDEVRLNASAGIAPCKFLAKCASDAAKPDGQVTIGPAQVEEYLHRLTVEQVPGIGTVTAEKCHRLGLHRLVDLRRLGEDGLRRHFGSSGSWFWELAWGRDERPVEPSQERKSIGAEDTFDRDVDQRAVLEAHLAELAQRVAERLHRQHVTARHLTLKLKYHDFHQVTRGRTLHDAVGDPVTLQALAQPLLDQAWDGRSAVRLLGLSCALLDGSGTRQERWV